MSLKKKLFSLMGGMLVLFAVNNFVSFLLVSGLKESTLSTLNRDVPVIDGNMEMRLSLTSGHLWYEELMAGDKEIKYPDIIAQWNESIERCNGVIDLLDHESTPPDLLPARDMMIKARESVKQLIAFSKIRLKNKGVGFAGTKWDRKFDVYFNQADGLIEKSEAIFHAYLDKKKEDTIDRHIQIDYIMSVIFFISLLLAGVGGTVIIRGLLVSLTDAKMISSEMTQGRLNVQLKHFARDETGQLLKAMLGMAGKIKEVIHSIQDSSVAVEKTVISLKENSSTFDMVAQEQAGSMEQAAAASEELQANIQNVTEKVESMSAQLSEIEEVIENLNSNIQSVTEEIKVLASLAAETGQNTGAGEEMANHASFTMQKIKGNTEKISEIIKLITDISERTNLLSLNAAIEAARAGEGGRGFAVVADEISKLASQTASSVDDIRKLIETNHASVAEGDLHFKQVAQSLNKINTDVLLVARSVDKIKAASLEQSESSGRISSRAKNITEFAREITVVTREQHNAAVELTKTAANTSEKSETISQGSSELNTLSKQLESAVESMRKDMSYFKLS